MARKKYYRNGDPLYYTYFNDRTWDSMTEEQKALWTPADDIEEQAIPQEVTEFMKEPKVSPRMTEDKTIKSQEKEIEDLKRQLNELHALYEKAVEMTEAKESESPPEEKTEPEKPKYDPTDREFLKKELTKLGVDFDKRLSTKRLAAKYEEIIKSNTDATN